MKDSDWRDMRDFCNSYLATVGDLAGCWPAREQRPTVPTVRTWRQLVTDCRDFLGRLVHRWTPAVARR